MEQALALAALVESASPNPRVGCVVVRDGRAVGWGYHREAGAPHAEAIALDRAGSAAAGATVYVNLEPCAHQGRTPPCADLLIARKVARVVASVIDPNPLVNGRGFGRLAEAGVTVDTGELAERARALNQPFFHRLATGRPLVVLKAALSIDGQIAADAGRSRWISAAPARRFAHRLRMRSDAILVGAGTIRSDDPALTVRLAGVTAPRLRVVIAPDLALSPDARVFARPSPTEPIPRIYVAEGITQAKAAAFVARAEVVRVPARAGTLDLGAILDDLGRVGVQSLLVEGGGRTISSFLAAGLASRVALFVAPRFIGALGATPLLSARAVERPDLAPGLVTERIVPLGSDLLLLGRVVASAAG